MSEHEEQTEWIDVLLVEDNLGDVRLAREAFREVNPSIRLHVAVNGVEAMAFLQREGVYAQAPRPSFILLDLNLPMVNGHEVLGLIKRHRDLKRIPTVVLSNSEREADISMSYQLEANCYLRKPTHWDAFDSLIRSINKFWLLKTRLPAKDESWSTDRELGGMPYPS